MVALVDFGAVVSVLVSVTFRFILENADRNVVQTE